MLKIREYHNRFIPNMNTVVKWNLGDFPIDITICPSGKVARGLEFTVKGERVHMGIPWTNNDKSIVIIDQRFFSRHNIKINHYFPEIEVSYRDYEPVIAVAKPAHLLLLTPLGDNKTVKLTIHTMLYGMVTFSIIQAKCMSVMEDTLLVPPHLWDFIQTAKSLWTTDS
jgi:hypothetical protein